MESLKIKQEEMFDLDLVMPELVNEDDIHLMQKHTDWLENYYADYIKYEAQRAKQCK